MTATTSKLGADMLTDEILAPLWDELRYAKDQRAKFTEIMNRALLARQPAAIDKDTHAAVEFYEANPSAALMDFQKRFTAAPSVEQGERGVCDRYQVLNEAGEALLAANHGEAYEVIYRMMKDARAASTSANVAQLDMSLEARLTDAEADVKRLHAEKMELWNQVHGYSANVAQGSEAVAWFTDDSQSDKSATTWDRNVAERWRTKGWPVSPLYAAPPAQTATTVTRAMVKAAIPWLTGLHHMRNTDAKAHIEEAIKAALTAAQSASGDTK